MRVTVKYLGATNTLPSRMRANLVTRNNERAQLTQSVNSLDDASNNTRISKELPAQHLASMLLEKHGIGYRQLDYVPSASNYVFNVVF